MPAPVKINKEDLEQAIVSGAITTDNALEEEEEEFLDKSSEELIQLEALITKKEFNLLLRQNREEKKKYAKLIFRLTCWWTSIIFITILANGISHINGHQYFEFSLSDQVIITLITSTTINFFGFFLLVVKYLFNTKDISIAEKNH